jgi:hypothetical protein
MHDDNLAEIWRSAKRRRADDIYSWFTDFFKDNGRLKSSEPRLRNTRRRAAASICKLLEATHAMSPTTN